MSDHTTTRSFNLSSVSRLLLTLLGGIAQACDVPVCEYALNLWPADPYELVVVHREEPMAQQVITTLKDVNGANLIVRNMAPDSTDPLYESLLQPYLAQPTPWIALRFPVRGGVRNLLWRGVVDAFNISEWINSPVREQTAKYLQEGAAGVWIFLASDGGKDDSQAWTMLNQELDRLTRVLKLAGTGDINQARPITFPCIRLDRNNQAEQPLIQMLLKSEPELELRSKDSMVFPIYGRGLVLYALVGAGININNITDAAEFLTGECACEVKSDNPGLELLMQVNWEESLVGGFSDFQLRANRAVVKIEDIRGEIPAHSLEDILPLGDNMSITEAKKVCAACWIGGIVLVGLLLLVTLSRRKVRRKE